MVNGMFLEGIAAKYIGIGHIKQVLLKENHVIVFFSIS